MLRSIENICSYVQCRWRNVWRVYIDFNTLSCLNYFVQRVWGVYKMVVEILKGWGGYFSGQKMEILGRREALHEIPSMVGVWIFTGTTQCPCSSGVPFVYSCLLAVFSKALFLAISLTSCSIAFVCPAHPSLSLGSVSIG